MSNLTKKKRILLAQSLVCGLILTGFSFFYTTTTTRSISDQPLSEQQSFRESCIPSVDGVQPMIALTGVTEKQHGLPLPYITDKPTNCSDAGSLQTTPDISFARFIVDVLSWTIISAIGIFVIKSTKPAKKDKK